MKLEKVLKKSLFLLYSLRSKIRTIFIILTLYLIQQEVLKDKSNSD